MAPDRLRSRIKYAGFAGVPCVFTIHNIAYTGTFDPSWLPALDLGWDLFRPESIEYWSRISFLKAGIVFSDLLTTVSPTYAREIQTPYFGCGLQGVLLGRSARLHGIVNGVDYDIWNPATDVHLAKRIGDAVRSAYHGNLETKYSRDEYLVRVNWTR